jgi:hypothetical protein
MRSVVCPLYNFQISEKIEGDYSRDQRTERLNQLRQQFQKGFTLSDDVILRQMTPEVLESVKSYQPFWENFNATLRVDLRTFIIEIQLSEKMDFEFEIDKALLAFRLFQICNVFCKIAWFIRDGKVTSVAIRDTPIQDRSTFWYIDMYQSPFQIEDMDEVSRLLNQINQTNLNERQAMRIATERFMRSFAEHQLDEKIIDLFYWIRSHHVQGKSTYQYWTVHWIRMCNAFRRGP